MTSTSHCSNNTHIIMNAGDDYVAPSSTCLTEELLFFDTFSHSEPDNNFDLVQFPSPIVIDLIKIVPLGQRIEAKIPGGVRLGATNPSKFELDFFVNDLTKQNAHTFTDLGKFDYSEKATEFSPSAKIHTDGLLLRGNYRTLTLAILGQVASLEQLQEQQQTDRNVVASPPAQTPASPAISEREVPMSASNVIVRHINNDLLTEVRQSPESINRELMKDGIELDQEKVGVIIEDALMNFVNSANNSKSGGLEEISSSDDGLASPNASPQNQKNEELEEISSSDVETTIESSKQEKTSKDSESAKDVKIEEVRNDHIEWKFDPLSYKAEPLLYFADPSMTNQERNIQSDRVLRSQDTYPQNFLEQESKRMLEAISKTERPDNIKTEDWVAMIEEIVTGIDSLSLNQCLDDPQVVEILVQQVCHGLDFELALQQPQTVYKVRHLRAGLKLATILFHCDELAVASLLKYEIPKKVLMLFHKPNMSLPIRLQIFRCLDAACDSLVGIQAIMFQKYEWPHQELENTHESPSRDLRKQEDVNEVKEDGRLKYEKTEEQGDDTEINHMQERKESQLNLMTCYQYLLSILLKSPPTRVVIAIGSLFKKVTLYESLHKLSQSVDSSTSAAMESEAIVFNHMDLVIVLQDIVQLVEGDCVNIAQPIRYLPANNQFHVKPCRIDPYLAVYKWLKHFRTLDKINIILSHFQQKESNDAALEEIDCIFKVQTLCLNFVKALLSSPRGLHLFLSSDFIESTNNLLDILLCKKYYAKKEGPGPIKNINRALERRYYDLGIMSAFSFKMYYCIDKLFDFHREVISGDAIPEDAVPEPILHQIFILSDHPYGREALLKHFSCGGNLDCLLRFLEMPDIQREVDIEFNKETCIEYSLEILEIFLQLNESVLEMSDEYLETLTDLCKSNNIIATRVRPLLQWLTPYGIDRTCLMINYSDESFKQLLRVIRRSIPNHSKPFADGLNFKIPTQLITTIRILRQLCIPPQVELLLESISDPQQHLEPRSMHITSNHQNNDLSNNSDADNHIETFKVSRSETDDMEATSKLFYPYDDDICGNLKYHYGITQVFEHEGLKRLLVILKELNGNYSKPIYQSAALSGVRGQLVLSLIKSVILLIQSIVSHSIDARGGEFKDTSAIPVILETYSLLSFVPKPQDDDHLQNIPIKFDSINSNTLNYFSAKQTQKLILSTLMSYTQMCLSASEEKVISKSVWTKMLQEIVDFTLSAPLFFYHGLEIFSKMLPKPLSSSNSTDSADQEQQLFRNVNHRKLWSAHLHPIHSKIEQMICFFSISCQPRIRDLLLYLCNQLSDLSATTACMVAKSVLDSLMTYSSKMFNDDKENNYATKITLDFLATLTKNKSFDVALVNHLQANCKKDEKTNLNLQNLIKFLSSNLSDHSDDQMTICNNSNNSTVDAFIKFTKILANGLSRPGCLDDCSIQPPEKSIKINLMDLTRRSSDRFDLVSSLRKSYRLKVLMDIKSSAHRSADTSKRFDYTPHNSKELSVPSGSKRPYVAPLRGRGRLVNRGDSFRSRPQNTSRPPSIHVDDFIDLYGDASSSSSSKRYSSSSKSDYRSIGNRAYEPHHQPNSGRISPNRYHPIQRRSAGKSKYMKMN